ncbi:DgyrCDS5304 [Dimorphilus gyrociliatus]|uniref:DgyrCDS5304 n=1 Tax=Dimorphilus gyrociliatus TaxID=2664684 RepID=A0A7I8VL53_9ANNE|nr:DgyrCDS5304 [Dimorphilus gyrociliatus]
MYRIIQLPKEVYQYLLCDGIVLPKGSCGPKTTYDGASIDSDSSWDEEETDDKESQNQPHFPDFDNEIRGAIKALGGAVFPKLNWSAPRDACWMMSGNSLKCYHPSDVYLALKSSNFIMRDLTEAYIKCEDYENTKPREKFDLILKRYHELNPACEFRCFVKKRKFIAISQRYCDTFYSHIEEEREAIMNDLHSFFENNIKERFEFSDVFDVYRPQPNKKYVIDFNPFGSVTDSLLFDWNEIEDPEFLDKFTLPKDYIKYDTCFRFVTGNNSVQPNPIRCSSSIPQDFLDLSAGTDVDKLMDFMKLSKNDIQ